jgi:ribosomal protein S18 acetylase RimI-like enzyme
VAISIRRASSAAAAGVAAVHVGSWRETYAGIFPDEILAGLCVEKRTRFWREKLDESATWVACDGDEVVGFLNIGPCRDDELAEAQEIYCMYLRRAQFGLGAGRELLRAGMEYVGRGVVTLWVLEQNDRARRFYEKAGFEPDGTILPAGHFGVTDPKMRYRKDLDA